MKVFNKFYLIGSVIIVLFFFSACGSTNEKTDTAEENVQIANTEKTQEIKISNVGKWLKLNPKNNIFLENNYEYSVTIHSGDSVRWKIESEDVIRAITITQERTGKVIHSKNNVKSCYFQHKVLHTDVYTLKITDKTSKYLNLTVERMPQTELSASQSTDFIYDSIDCKKGTKNAIVFDDIVLVKAVNEPRKVVLDGYLNLAGESRVIIPLELPTGTNELLYELRISKKNEKSYEDGQLFNKVSTKISEYKVLGYPIFESKSTGSSITRELLNAILPTREEVTANVFFFPDEKNARAFADNSPKGYNYDTKNSIKNTQSMNGLIKPQKNGFVYLGFQSTSNFSSTYIWLDAVAFKIVKRYILIKKVPKESTSY